MIKNGIRAIWDEGGAAINGWLSVPSPFVTEIMAEHGYDSLCVDMQHGMVDFSDLIGMLQAMRASKVTPVVRVPWLDPASIMKALDAGAYAIICPMINSGEDARRLASYMRYPPDGVRSFGPTRANISAGANYASEAGGEVICFAMVETAEAVENLDDIVGTDGIDGIYIGPADLTLGVAQGVLPPGFDREEDEMVRLIRKILATAHEAGKRACLHCMTPEYAARAIDLGFDLVTVASDARLLAAASAQSVTTLRGLLAGSDAPE
jgi:4-hydroxy-2-oxoheptanedioate aldolase